MKAGVIFSESGPILIMTTHDRLDEPALASRLGQKGIHKYIAYEVPVETVRERYGQHFNVIMGDRSQTDELRVVDEEGHRVFYNFNLGELNPCPIHHDETEGSRKAA